MSSRTWRASASAASLAFFTPPSFSHPPPYYFQLPAKKLGRRYWQITSLKPLHVVPPVISLFSRMDIKNFRQEPWNRSRYLPSLKYLSLILFLLSYFLHLRLQTESLSATIPLDWPFPHQSLFFYLLPLPLPLRPALHLLHLFHLPLPLPLLHLHISLLLLLSYSHL